VEHFPHQLFVNISEYLKQLKHNVSIPTDAILPASVAVALADHLVDFHHVTV
jgi:hypothetical protein